MKKFKKNDIVYIDGEHYRIINTQVQDKHFILSITQDEETRKKSLRLHFFEGKVAVHYSSYDDYEKLHKFVLSYGLSTYNIDLCDPHFFDYYLAIRCDVLYPVGYKDTISSSYQIVEVNDICG
jgi:hypothetical protein